jgi:hypothetical protein
LYHLFVFNCFLLYFILFSILALASPVVVKHLSKWIELIYIDYTIKFHIVHLLFSFVF